MKNVSKPLAKSVFCRILPHSAADGGTHKKFLGSETTTLIKKEIKERELMSKRLSNYIASCDYFDKSLIFLSKTTGGISVVSFATVTGVPVGILSECFSLAFLISTGIVKELLKSTRNKKNKHNKIVLLATSKLNSTESKISEALINNEISHEDFMTIIKEKKIYRELKKILE